MVGEAMFFLPALTRSGAEEVTYAFHATVAHRQRLTMVGNGGHTVICGMLDLTAAVALISAFAPSTRGPCGCAVTSHFHIPLFGGV